jgi:hypothetical protein
MNLKHAHDTVTTLVAPAARQDGTAERSLGRGPPRSRAKRPLGGGGGSASLEGQTPPRARSASLEGPHTHVASAPAHVHEHLLL